MIGGHSGSVWVVRPCPPVLDCCPVGLVNKIDFLFFTVMQKNALSTVWRWIKGKGNEEQMAPFLCHVLFYPPYHGCIGAPKFTKSTWYFKTEWRFIFVNSEDDKNNVVLCRMYDNCIIYEQRSSILSTRDVHLFNISVQNFHITSSSARE